MELFKKDIDKAGNEIIEKEQLKINDILKVKKAVKRIKGEKDKRTLREIEIMETLNKLKKPTEKDKDLIIKLEILKIIYND